VATVLEGSVRKSGKRVRITAQLIQVASDSHLWSETYDRELEITARRRQLDSIRTEDGSRLTASRGPLSEPIDN